MTHYNDEFMPPAPLLNVKLAGVVHARPRVEIPALIDTGSDVTAIPAAQWTRAKLSLK